jgi:hypothetical protein
MRKIGTLIALLLLAPALFAQGGRHDGIAQGINGRPIGYATITVCATSASGTPCSPTTTIYTDDTLHTPMANPFQADGWGNFHFSAAPGHYLLTITSSGITNNGNNVQIVEIPCLPDSTNCGGGGGGSFTFTTVPWSATPTFTITGAHNAFQMILSGNVTSSTIAGSAVAGDVATFDIINSGSFTMVWPLSFNNAPIITNGSLGTTHTDAMFIFDGSGWNALPNGTITNSSNQSFPPGAFVISSGTSGNNVAVQNNLIYNSDTTISQTLGMRMLGPMYDIGGNVGALNYVPIDQGDGTYLWGPQSGGGGGSPGGSLNQMQFNNSSTFGGSASLFDNGGKGVALKGPDPWVDATAYGAVGLGTGSAGVTASITATSTSATFSAIPSRMKVGSGVAIQGAGANGDYLIAGIISISGTTVGLSTQAQTTVSSATVNYDDGYPIQTALNAICTSSGGALNFPPTQGSSYGMHAPAQITITSTSLTSNVVTATLATALPSQIITGYFAVVSGDSYAGANGTFQVTVVDSTHVTYASAFANGTGTGGTISFPALQINVTCNNLYATGGNDGNGTGTQFSRPPKTILSQAGNSLAPPLIIPGWLVRTATLEHLVISAGNQALQFIGGAGLNLNDVCLTNGYSTNPAGATADNAPLAIYNSFWIRMRDGCLTVSNGGHSTQFAAVIGYVGNLPQPNNTGLIDFEDVIGSGGSYLIDARNGGGVNGGGNLIWKNSQLENSSTSYLTITNTGGGTFPQIGPVEIDNGAAYDCSLGQPFINLNASGTFLGPVLIYTSPQCAAGAGAPIQVTAGNVDNVHLIGTDGPTLDSSANLFGPGIVETSNGMDLIGVNDTNSQSAYMGLKSVGSTLRMGKKGDQNATVALTPFFGLLMGPGGGSSVCGVTSGTYCGGYDETFIRNSSETTDLEYAQALPPLNFTAAPTTGGSLANGTYWYAIETAGASGSTYSSYTYTSVTLSGSNNAVSLSWTAPGGTHPTNCQIFRSTNTGFVSKPQYNISNCTSTTTFTDTGAGTGTGSPSVYNQTLTPFYHFAADTTNPAGGTVPYYTGTPASGDCASWGGAGKLADPGAACQQTNITTFAPMPNALGTAAAPTANNAINIVRFTVPVGVTFSHLVVDVGTADTGGNFYDSGIYSNTGATLLCDWGAQTLGSTGKVDIACAQGSVTLAPGNYIFAWTGNGTTATIYFGAAGAGAGGWEQLSSATASTSSTGGALPSSITLPSAGSSVNSTYANVFIYLH